jgi:hypothetical protein
MRQAIFKTWNIIVILKRLERMPYLDEIRINNFFLPYKPPRSCVKNFNSFSQGLSVSVSRIVLPLETSR